MTKPDTLAAARPLTYFVSDVHLGLQVGGPAGREARFVDFLRSIPADRTEALYLLGDIWDFWYEYRDVVPKGYSRVFAALLDLIDAGVEVFFIQGNHDIWCYSYFQELGIKVVQQPCLVSIAGKSFCLGHGDGLGPGHFWYKVMRTIFRNRFCQSLFSLLHPTVAFRIGTGWSRKSRVSRRCEYVFKGPDEPLWKFAEAFSASHKVDFFVFGHFHTQVDMALPSGSRLLVLKDWVEIQSSSFIVFDGSTVRFGNS